MSAKLSSTAVSSHSSTPGFLLSDDYLAADLSDADEPDTLPALTLHEHTLTQHNGASSRQEDGIEETDEDGVVKLAVDDETRAQLQEIQGALSAQLGAGKPHPSHFSTAFSSQRAAHDRLAPAVTSSVTSSRFSSNPSLHDPPTSITNHYQHHTSAASTTGASVSASSLFSSSSSSTNQSSLLALLASKDADLQLAAQLGAALSDKTETLEQYCRHLEQQLAALQQLHTALQQHPNTTTHGIGAHTQPSHSSSGTASPTHRTSHSLSSIADGSTAEEEVSRLRLELGRLERRMAVSESWHRDALKLARKERRETEERVQELEKEGKRREAEEVDRRKRDEEERRRLTEEVEQLHAMEQQRLLRERELRRQRELKEKEDDDEQRHRREENEQAEHRWRDEQRKREESERRCRTLEKQRDDAIDRATQQAKDFEQRRRRWEQERGRAVDDELERHRTQAKALAEQYRAVEEQMKQQQSGNKRTLSVDTSGRASPSPSTPPLSGDDMRERRAVLVSHSTQTPGEWMQQLDRAESAMTIQKGRSESERVLYSPLQFTLLSPSTTDEAGKESREEKKEVATLVSGVDARLEVEDLVIPLSLVTPPRQTTRSPYLSPQSPLPTAVEVTEEDERALTEVVAPTIPTAAVADGPSDAAVDETVVSKVSFLSPVYAQQVGLSPFAAAEQTSQPSIVSAGHSNALPTTPSRRPASTATLSSFRSPLLTRPIFRSPPPASQSAATLSASSTAATSPLLFTLHTSHPSSIRAHLTVSSSSAPLPPLLPLSTPFAQLQSSLIKQGSSAGGGGGRLQPCTDDATKRVFSLLMQTRMGEGVAGFG